MRHTGKRQTDEPATWRVCWETQPRFEFFRLSAQCFPKFSGNSFPLLAPFSRFPRAYLKAMLILASLFRTSRCFLAPSLFLCGLRFFMLNPKKEKGYMLKIKKTSGHPKCQEKRKRSKLAADFQKFRGDFVARHVFRLFLGLAMTTYSCSVVLFYFPSTGEPPKGSIRSRMSPHQQSKRPHFQTLLCSFLFTYPHIQKSKNGSGNKTKSSPDRKTKKMNDYFV